MIPTFYCPECENQCMNESENFDENTPIDDEYSLDFGCEICGCEFTVTYHKPTVNVTKHGDNKGGK